MEGGQEEPGMILQVIRKVLEEKASNCPHNIIEQIKHSFNALTAGTKIKL